MPPNIHALLMNNFCYEVLLLYVMILAIIFMRDYVFWCKIGYKVLPQYFSSYSLINVIHVFIILTFTATSKDVIDHFSHYLTTEMDGDLIVEYMLSQQLLNDQEVHTTMSAASSFQKNCLILEKIRLMDTKSLVSFCETLQMFDCHKNIASVLLNGKLM